MKYLAIRLLLLLVGSSASLTGLGQVSLAQPVVQQPTVQPTIQCIKAPCELPSSKHTSLPPQSAIQCFVAPCELPQSQFSQEQPRMRLLPDKSYPSTLLEYLF